MHLGLKGINGPNPGHLPPLLNITLANGGEGPFFWTTWAKTGPHGPEKWSLPLVT